LRHGFRVKSFVSIFSVAPYAPLRANSMKEPINGMPADVAGALELGQLMGQNQTFGVVAGRCSAAQAATLRRLRDGGTFKVACPRWRDFCAEYLKISGAEADRIIQHLEEFGPGYFDLAQLVRISAETYRAIAPSIRDGALQIEGGAMVLSVENARKLTAAVAELRRAIPKKKPRPPLAMHQRVTALDKQWTGMIAEFREISRLERCGENWLPFSSVLSRAISDLRRLGLENGIV